MHFFYIQIKEINDKIIQYVHQKSVEVASLFVKTEFCIIYAPSRFSKALDNFRVILPL